MGQKYKQLSALERSALHTRILSGESLRSIGRALGRSASTMSREISRNVDAWGVYDSCAASYARRDRRRRGLVKLREGSALRAYAFSGVRLGWSPQQICGKLREMRDSDTQGPGLPTVSHETIYRAIYVLPRGEIRKELIGLLRQGKSTRGRRKTGTDNKRGGLIGMVSIHDRPVDVLTRAFPGHWEGDFIKGAGNASAIGTLIERKSRYTILVKMHDCSSQAALTGFTRELGKVPEAMRLTMAYDQGTEMARHKDLAKALNMKVYFCDPHSPWQRPSNENMNGLVRQYLPKGIDLSIYSQADLDRIAESLNARPRACHGFRAPWQVFEEECRKMQSAAV